MCENPTAMWSKLISAIKICVLKNLFQPDAEVSEPDIIVLTQVQEQRLVIGPAELGRHYEIFDL
jgi:hypothetical protein